MTLSIIIVNWNTRGLLSHNLQSVQRAVEELSCNNVQTFVVDNASCDGSQDMVLDRFPWVKLIENQRNIGFARANNQAIRQSTGEYVLLLNSDTEVHTGALRTLVAFMDDHPQAGACGARLLNGNGCLQHACHPMLTPEREFWRLAFLDQIWPWATYAMETWDTVAPRRVEVIKGACLLLRRETLEQVGLLDERYHMYTEEVDLCYRLDRAGWQLWYVPAAVVTHYGGASSSQNAEKMYLELYRSKVQFYRKIGGVRLARKFKLFLMIAYFPRAVLQPKNSTYRRLLARLRVM